MTEYSVGWEVFERTKDYDPSNDSIVRTAARQLRTKVRDYFDEEGSGETLTLDIPKGGYLVSFAPRDAPQSLPSPTLRSNAEPAAPAPSARR